MKLSAIRMERRGLRRPIQITPISDRLTIIVDPAQQREGLGSFISDMLFGGTPGAKPSTERPETMGWLDLCAGGHRFRVSHHPEDPSRSPILTPLDGKAPTPEHSPLPRLLSRSSFRTLYCWDSEWPTLDQVLAALEAMCVRADGASPSQAESRHKIGELTETRDRMERSLSCYRRNHQTEAIMIQEQLEGLTERIERCNAQIQAAAARRDLLDQQILELERCDKQDGSTPATMPITNRELAMLYDRLDELDAQWRAWRRVQQRIQQQRITVRDQHTRLADLTPEAAEHPYHTACRILRDLESKWTETMPKPHAIAEVQGDECCQLLADLSVELDRQYKHIRHRAAAAELRQLRACYQELSAASDQLMQRRSALIEQIHSQDPEGAELVLRGGTPFHSLALKEGYYRARTKFTRPSIPASASETEDDVQLWQLDSLRQQRREAHDEIARVEAELRQWIRQRDLVIDQNIRLLNSERELRSQLERAESDLQSAMPSLPAKQAAVEGLRFSTDRKALVQRANTWLQILTEGELTQLAWPEGGKPMTVCCRQQAPVDARRLDRQSQQQVAFCLCISAIDMLRQHGIHLPMLMSEPHRLCQASDWSGLIQLCNRCLQAGQQILLIVSRSADVAVLASLQPTVLDLDVAAADTTVFPATIKLADSHTFRESMWKNSGRNRPTEVSAGGETADGPVFRYPIDRRRRFEISGTSWERATIGAYSASASALSPSSRIYDAGMCGPTEYAALVRCGINTVGELLGANPETLPKAVTPAVFTPRDVRRWQACCRLMISIPEMTPTDAQLLFDCGFQGPEDLEDVRGELLLRRLGEHLSATGRAGELSRFNVERINTWMRSLARTRPHWPRIHRTAVAVVPTCRQGMSEWLAPIQAVPFRDAAATQLPDGGPYATEWETEDETNKSTEANRFFLNLNDSVNAAPSIGTKTCEQLNEIGICTVRDLLDRTADDISRQMNQRRITPETVSLWQQQARLGVSVPNLRRRDVQILVACGVNDPERLARMNPDQLWASVQQFMKSKPGMRLIRSGKKPDQQQVCSWIRWAQSHRRLQAA